MSIEWVVAVVQSASAVRGVPAIVHVTVRRSKWDAENFFVRVEKLFCWG